MKSEPVIIKGDGYNLSGTLVKPEGNENVLAVIFYHGMISQSKPRQLDRAMELSKMNIGSLVFDLRGCGESDGKLGELSLKDFLDDSILAIDFLLSQAFVDNDRVGICGHSFGGGLGTLVSEKRNVKSMVLQAPAVYPDDWFKKNFSWDDESSKKRREYRFSDKALDNRNIRAIEKYKGDLLEGGCELDDPCPPNIIKG